MYKFPKILHIVITAENYFLIYYIIHFHTRSLLGFYTSPEYNAKFLRKILHMIFKILNYCVKKNYLNISNRTNAKLNTIVFTPPIYRF